MIVSPQKILSGHFSPKRVVYNLDNRELIEPEGVGFDLRIDALFEISSRGGAGIGVSTRQTPESTVVASENSIFYLRGNTSYLATTIERFDLPQTVSAQFFPRSTLFRSGIVFQSSVLPPGYEGPMTFMLYNSTSSDFFLERGARFSHALFMEVDGDVNLYRGQWNGGRVSSPDPEQQV